MRETNIRSIDLNLLVVLKALLEEKHVTRAAERIGLSQPATSRALARLRQLLNDPLLVRSQSGLILTTRASELYQHLETIFGEIKQVISPPVSDPADMQGDIVLATRDYEMAAILPRVINTISKKAPQLTLTVMPLLGDNLDLLDRQKVDFVISATDSQAASLYRTTLYEEDFVCLLSSENPVIKKKLTLKNYLAMKHCLVSITGYGPGLVDTILAKEKLKRNVTIRIPYFLAAASIVAESDLIVTLPRHLAEMLSRQENLIMLEPPIKMPSFPIYLYWHIRNHNNAQHRWLREIIRGK